MTALILTLVKVIVRKSMKILIDQNIPGVAETFAHHGNVTKVAGRTLHRQQLLDVQALIVRSVTSVNAALLEGTAIRFVGTTTIGTDHLDLPWLEHHGIRWASAPGCNADAAAQYTLAMMLLAGQRLGFKLTERSVGIIGRGNVGSRVLRLLAAYGVTHIKVCDPPLADAGDSGLCAPEDIHDCEIITLHVPLSHSGRYATIGLVGETFLSHLKAGTLLINTSRGKVTDGQALHNWLTSGRGHAALDVWPDEPDVDIGLLGATTVATPHVAGYSLDGKLRGTRMVYHQFCDWLETSPVNQEPFSDLTADTQLVSPGLTLDGAILAACPVNRDDRQMRELANLSALDRPASFDALRRNYPERRDFSGWQVPPGAPPALARTLQDLGFKGNRR